MDITNDECEYLLRSSGLIPLLKDVYGVKTQTFIFGNELLLILPIDNASETDIARICYIVTGVTGRITSASHLNKGRVRITLGEEFVVKECCEDFDDRDIPDAPDNSWRITNFLARYPDRQPVSPTEVWLSARFDDPPIFVIENFLSQAGTAAFIRIGSSLVERVSYKAHGEEEETVYSSGRRCWGCWIPHDYNKITLSVAKIVAEHVGISLAFAEKFHILRYDQGDEFIPHFDAAHPHNTEEWAASMSDGQRIVTVILYLNSLSVEDGGATYFPELDFTITPQQGRMVVFGNTLDGINPHPKSLHAGLPVTGNTSKWVCVMFFKGHGNA